MSDEAIDVIVQHANEATSPVSAVIVEQYGGAAARVGAHETAFGRRRAQNDLAILAQWTDARESERHIRWVATLPDAMAPYRSGNYMLNFLGERATTRSRPVRSVPRPTGAGEDDVRSNEARRWR